VYTDFSITYEIKIWIVIEKIKMSNDDIVKLLDLIKKRAVDILNRLDKTTVENPGSW
jgi:hypothetical protein